MLHFLLNLAGAARLGEDEASQLLQQTLEEEKEAAQGLTILASAIKVKATPDEIIEDEENAA